MKINKAGDLKREITISLIVGGKRVELDGRALTARQVEEIDRLHPTPQPPRYQDKDGVWKHDDTDPAYRTAVETALMARLNMRAAAVLGPSFFDTDSITAQVATLLDTFTADHIAEIVRQARTSSTVERADVEAAKAEMLPFVVTSAGAGSS